MGLSIVDQYVQGVVDLVLVVPGTAKLYQVPIFTTPVSVTP